MRTWKCDCPRTNENIGTNGQCKTCDRERYKRYRAANLEKERLRGRTKGNKSRVGKRYAGDAYANWSEARKEGVRRSVRRWERDHPDRRAAHKAVYHALAMGELVRPDSCERCGRSVRLHGHHADYTKPLDVQWLCPLCHKAAHRELAEAVGD